MDSLTTSQAAGIGAILGISVMMVFFLIIAFYVLYIVAFWKIFDKAGEAGWKSIIPFYNVYIQFKLTWETKWFWIAIVSSVLGSILCYYSESYSIVNIIGLIATLAFVVIIFIDYFYLCKSFGKGTGFFIGMIFFEYIFTMILGFGSAQYLGNAGKNEIR